MIDAHCESIRPLLFVALEGQLDRDERVLVNAHLAYCESCRSFERSERAMTDLLDPIDRVPRAVPTWRVARIAATLAIVAALAVLLFVLPAATPAGSIVERRLGPEMTWVGASKTELRLSNHMSVPRFGSITIELPSGLRLDATGPARFELDLVGDRWKVIVLSGVMRVRAEKADCLVVVNRAGHRVLGAGSYLLTIDSIRPQDKAKGRSHGDIASLIASGQRLFYAEQSKPNGGSKQVERVNMAAAEKCFRSALADRRMTDEQRNTALFYLGACQSRQGRNADALATGERWLKLFPNDAQRSYVLFFQAAYHERLGRPAEARRIREQIIAEDPDSTMAGHARTSLRHGMPGPRPKRGAAVPKAGPLTTRLAATRSKPGPYLVLRVGLDATARDDAGYLAAAKAAAKFHDAVTQSWDGRDFAKLERILKKYEPENVLFVLRPGTLDINLHRNILLKSAAIDDDIFVDFAFGYLTSRTGAQAGELWKRIERLHRRGLASRRWVESSVTSGKQSLEHPGSVPAIAKVAGFAGEHFYVAVHDPKSFEFVDRKFRELEKASVIQFTGNGDPQGIWLFDDRRNLDRSKHWPYAADKVGHDPKGEMPRITAERFRKLRLAAPIVWSGTCHSAATCRVFVEGDIVSTFGRTDVATVHRLAPENSLCLALLEAGSAALLAPIGANHGMSVMMETDFALRHGATLGEVIKSTYDDVLLAASGKLVLDLQEEGRAHPRREWVMQGGGANRILIGDPALRPFKPVESPIERVKVQKTKRGFTVTVDRGMGFPPRGWDIYGRSRPDDWRIILRVDLKGLTRGDRGVEYTAKVTAQTPDGSDMPYRMRRCFAETYHGRRYLHLQANGNRQTVERKAVRAVFDVRVR